MKCREHDCNGEIDAGLCQSCGAPGGASEGADETVRQGVIDHVRSVLGPREMAPTAAELQSASSQLRQVVPYNYEAWRLHADLLLTALRQLQTRAIEPDDTVKLFVTPLREDQLRNAAERALRQCAHFADSAEKRIAAVDEANRIRRLTWF